MYCIILSRFARFFSFFGRGMEGNFGGDWAALLLTFCCRIRSSKNSNFFIEETNTISSVNVLKPPHEMK
jgi:hypothetical protein